MYSWLPVGGGGGNTKIPLYLHHRVSLATQVSDGHVMQTSQVGGRQGQVREVQHFQGHSVGYILLHLMSCQFSNNGHMCYMQRSVVCEKNKYGIKIIILIRTHACTHART